ncbi:hypothetical protein HRR86_005217 [Exophiala dermatitidis]|nr:hypothetical protein HRR82_005355 [Exophiala dermatitidis]KAJ4624795.1 hypothetical protein HRR86_005217 [Exophiala dermatitidis]
MSFSSTVPTSPDAPSSGGPVSPSSSTGTSALRQESNDQETTRFSMHTLLTHISAAHDYASQFVDIDKVIQERDEAVRKNEIRKVQLAEKEDEIKTLLARNKTYLSDFETRHEEWLKEFAQLKESMINQHILEVNELQAEITESRRQGDLVKKQLSDADHDIRLTRSRLDVATAELAQWKQYSSHMTPLDQLGLVSRIENLFKDLWKTVCPSLLEDLTPDLLKQDRDAWSSRIKQIVPIKLQRQFFPFEILLSNTRPAKLVRVALAMHIISSELTKQVFKPCYLPDSIESCAALQYILGDHLDADPKKVVLMRSLLLSNKTRDEYTAIIEQRSLSALDVVVPRLLLLCSNDTTAAGDKGFSLRKKLEAFFIAAAKLWQEIQYSDAEVRVVTCHEDGEVEQADLDWPWGHLDEYGPPRPAPHDNKLLLFPGFYLLNGRFVLHEGIVLTKNQKVVLDAEAEYQQAAAVGTATPAKSPRSNWNWHRITPTTRRLSLHTGTAGNGASPPPLTSATAATGVLGGKKGSTAVN